MPVLKLTIENVDEASAVNNADAVYRDTDVKGFSLKATPAGNKIFFFQYRIGGRSGITRKIKIGNFPATDPKEARNIARQYAAEIARKADPYERIKKETDLKLKAHGNTFEKLFEIYYDRQLRQNRSAAEAKQTIEREFFPSLSNTPIDTVSRADISAVLNKIYQRGAGYAANKSLAFVKTFFRWVVSEGYLQGDPTSGMQKPFKGVQARTRVLNDKEIKLVWNEFQTLGYPFGPVLQLLLLTGQREDEIAGLTWQRVDLENTTIYLSGGDTKNKLPHTVPVLDGAGSIIRGLSKQPAIGLRRRKKHLLIDKEKDTPAHSDFLFTTTGNTSISGWSRIKKTIDEGLAKRGHPITDWRFHDLRRTGSTRLGDLGYTDVDIDILTNHQGNRGVAAVYNHSAYMKKKTEMLKRWEKKLREIVGK